MQFGVIFNFPFIRCYIAVHEAGSIEATGHKINTIKTKEGKLTPQDIKSVIDF
ncbi:unnamed protein product, partial [marine sediment metagenome]